MSKQDDNTKAEHGTSAAARQKQREVMWREHAKDLYRMMEILEDYLWNMDAWYPESEKRKEVGKLKERHKRLIEGDGA